MTQNGESDLATGGMNQLEDPNAESYEDGLDETAAALLSEVLAGTPRGSQRSTGRRPAETPSAASSSSTAILHPRMGLPTHVLAELQQRHSVESHRELRHVETINDRSAPLIDAEVRIGESAHRALLTEIQRKASFISHFAQRIKLSSAVSAGLADARQRLRKVPNVNDRSEPLIPEGATVRKSVAPQVFAELSKSQVWFRACARRAPRPRPSRGPSTAPACTQHSDAPALRETSPCYHPGWRRGRSWLTPARARQYRAQVQLRLPPFTISHARACKALATAHAFPPAEPCGSLACACIDGVGQVVLRHVENTNDRSAPRIEEGVALRHDGRSALFDELKRKAAAAAAPFLR